MGRQGPCSHCGIKQTLHWRTGPPEKPVLCNACESRWRSRGTLDDYMPRHANRRMQRYQLFSEMTTRLRARDGQKLEVGVETSGQEGSLACLEEKMKNIPSLGSAGPSSINCTQIEETNEPDKDPLVNPDSVPKRKRLELMQLILSPVQRLQRQLYNNLQKPDFENMLDGDEDVTLIYARNHNIPTYEIGLGAMLFASQTTITECTTPLSPIPEDDAPFAMDVPVENPYRINNNVLDHVAMQNETTGNEDGKANTREISLAPHHMDTTSRASSSQELCSQRNGAQIGTQVKRPRGRPRLSTTQGTFLDKDRKSGAAGGSSQA